MLTNKYRPGKFGDVVGQDHVVSVFRSIIKSPETAARSIILHGPYGSGKTTLARLLVRGLNCQDKSSTEVCGHCEVCAVELSRNPFYQEWDATQVGNVEFIREYRQYLEYHAVSQQFWKVVIFDEIHAASLQAQTALLKVLEDVPPRTFFVHCTTDLEKMISTIRSRSIELPFQLVPAGKVYERLQHVSEKEGIVIPTETLLKIAVYSGGHMRDALMRLDLYMREEDKAHFIDSISSTERLILDFLLAAKRREKVQCQTLVGEFVKRPLAHLFRDWEYVVLSLLQEYVGVPQASPLQALYQTVSAAYGQELFRLSQMLAATWVEQCFKEDLLYQAFMWNVYYDFSKEQKQTVAGADPMARFRVQAAPVT